MILDIVTLNDQMLHSKSEEVKEIDTEIVKLVKDMYDTMELAKGVGLSAVQVGVLKRIFVTDVPQKGGKLVVINPVIKDLSEKRRVYEEGCLSIPGISGDIERPDTVVIEFLDIRGKLQRVHANSLLATCIQHEFDHLNGILFIDKLDPEIKLKKINEYRKQHRL
ncbi:MAG: peptide deformylase [Spirochaetes bacterium GWD1_27_9]|nr:MAG: peptide deformylase [Spirochaetes bacterium GWB1_27_13]OHD27259.1 MAG: peptide deformylase [Spirochaetes bacterium GWC1_27_15]OHD31382.1 MAG: peptide deformylase [Spirochaetes bacterium GWD1_27_9]